MPHLRLCISLLALISLGSLFAATPPVCAQENADVEPERPDVRLTLGGTIQPRFSYGRLALEETPEEDERERLGFGLRRARLRLEAQLTERVGAYFQLGAAGASVELLDGLFFYDLTDALRLRVGRFAPAQPRAFQLTSHKRIDLTARAAIARRWGASTLDNSGRDFGLEALYESDRFDLQAGVYNGNGSWDRALGNYRDDIVGDPTRGTETRGLAVGSYAAYRPSALAGLEVGGYGGYNAAFNPATRPDEADFPDVSLGPFAEEVRSYATYSGHLYWGARPGSQPVRLKADLVGTRYEALALAGPAIPEIPRTLEQHALGASLLGAVGFLGQSAELLARYERYDPALDVDDNAQDYLAAGASLSPSALRGRPYARQRLTLAYATRLDDDAHLLVLQAQLLF